MDSFSPIAMEVNVRDVSGYPDAASPQARAAAKDSDNLSAENQVVASVFFNLLQTRLNIQERTEKENGTGSTSGKVPAKKVSTCDVAGEKGISSVSAGDKIENSPSEGQMAQGKASLSSDAKGLIKTDTTDSQRLKAGRLAADGTAESSISEAALLKGEVFRKTLSAWLRNNGVSEETINRFFSQAKEIALGEKNDFKDGFSQKGLADFLKSGRIGGKELQNILASLKGGSPTGNNQANPFDAIRELVLNQGINSGNKAQVSSQAGMESLAEMLLLGEEMIGGIQTAEDGSFSTKSGFSSLMDQRQTLAAGDAAAMAKSENLPNLRPQLLIEQIVNARQMLEKNSGRVRMTLTPPSMGTLDMDVRVRNNRVEVTMTADNRDVKQMLLANLEDLKIALKEQGLAVDRFNVQWQAGDSGNLWGFAGGNPLWGEGGQKGQGGNSMKANIPSIDEARPLRSGSITENGSGLISVFI